MKPTIHLSFFALILVRLAYRLERSRFYRGLKQIAFKILEDPASMWRNLFDSLMIFFVLSTVWILVYEVTHPIPDYLYTYELVVVILFSVEYLLRMWIYNDSRQIIIQAYENAVETNTPFPTAPVLRAIVAKKVAYITSPLAIIDLLAILPSYRELRILRLLLLLRLLKIFRYTRTLNFFATVIKDKKFELSTLSVLVGFVVLVSATAIYTVEGQDPRSHINTFSDALYWALITITTVGYGDITPVSEEGRAITAVLVLGGIAVIAFLTSITAAAFTEKIHLFRKEHAQRETNRLTDFAIICGYGRIGQIMAQKFRREKLPFVIVDTDPERVSLARDDGFLVQEADATNTESLRALNIQNARYLLTVTGDEVTNLFIVLTARHLAPKLLIISRIDNKRSEKKFYRVGVDRVIYPYEIAGIASAMLSGQPVAFKALMGVLFGQTQAHLDELAVESDSFIEGKRIKEIRLEAYDIVLFGLVKGGEPTPGTVAIRGGRHLLFNPSPGVMIETGDVLVLFGQAENLKRFKLDIEESTLAPLPTPQLLSKES